MVAKVTQRNPGFAQEILRRYRDNKVLAVGYPVGEAGSSNRYPDGAEVLTVATANNFGTATIPRRDFFTPGAESAVEKTAPLVEELVPRLNSGDVDIQDLLEVMGPVAVGEFQQAIVELSDPPNAEVTIERKRSSNPLVDTGLLSQSISFQVREAE